MPCVLRLNVCFLLEKEKNVDLSMLGCFRTNNLHSSGYINFTNSLIFAEINSFLFFIKAQLPKYSDQLNRSLSQSFCYNTNKFSSIQWCNNRIISNVIREDFKGGFLTPEKKLNKNMVRLFVTSLLS